MAATIISLSGNLTDEALDRLTRDLRSDLSEAGITATPPLSSPGPGQRGDVSFLGQLLLDLVTGGAVVALIDCLKVFLQRDRSLSVSLKHADGTNLEITTKNVGSADVAAALTALRNLR